MNKDEPYFTPLHQKMSQSRLPSVSQCLCAWSDLLGFGNTFAENNWTLSPEQWNVISERLTAAYHVHCNNHNVIDEYMLVLNDGVVRARTLDHGNHPLPFASLWLRNILLSHIRVNQQEHDLGLPGTRTTIAAGEKAEYSFDEVRVDDLVLNYTRTAPGLSQLARKTGNPAIVNNPSALQMNTAFSKAYILDSLGSKFGIRGPNIFIDESLIDYLTQLTNMSSTFFEIERTAVESGELFAVKKKTPNPETPWVLGMELSEQIEIETRVLNTHVYKLNKFYPHDEHPDEFHFDVT